MTKLQRALIVGSSDGIGLETARRLVAMGWQVAGVSRSPGRLQAATYRHETIDVSHPDYRQKLETIAKTCGPFDACIYCAGIGNSFAITKIDEDVKVLQVNLIGAVTTAEVLLPAMVAAGAGHFVVLSSLADVLINAEYPSYSAAKAGMSSYFEGLALALRSTGVNVTNIRFGFVDTKMAKGPMRPLMMSVQEAADTVTQALGTKAIRISRPRRMAILMRLLRWLMELRVWLG